MDETMRFRAAVSCLSRLAQVEDHELGRFARTRLGDDVPVREEDLRRVRDIVRELGRAMARDDGDAWSRVREAHASLLGRPQADEPARPEAPAAPVALPSHLLAARAPAAAPGASPWAPIAPPPTAPAPTAPAPTAPAPIAPAPIPRVPAAAPAPAPAPAPDELRPALLSTAIGCVASSKPLPFSASAELGPIQPAAQRKPVPPPLPRPQSSSRLRATSNLPEGMPLPPSTPFPSPGQRPSPVPAAPPSGPPVSGAAPGVAASPAPAGQRFTFAQYASLRAELEARPDRRDAVLALYGIPGPEEMERVDAIWRRALSAQPQLAARFEELRAKYAHYLAAAAADPARSAR